MRRRNALIALSNNRGPFLSAIHSMNIYGALLKVVKYAANMTAKKSTNTSETLKYGKVSNHLKSTFDNY